MQQRQQKNPDFKGVFLPYQAKWTSTKAAVKVCEKGRRTGLSWAESGHCALTAASSKEAGGMNCWYLSYNKEMTQQFIQDCQEWARNFNLAASEVEEEIISNEEEQFTIYKIRFNSGFVVGTLPSKATAIRSKKGRVVIDEAAFVENLGEILESALALTMWGGSVHIISTHNGVDNDFNQLIEEIKAGKLDYYLQTISIDEALNQGLYKRICQVTKEEWSQAKENKWLENLENLYRENPDQELRCIPAKSGGVYIPGALVSSCSTDKFSVIRWSCQDGFVDKSDRERKEAAFKFLREETEDLLSDFPTLPVFAGEDFGRSGNLTSLCLLYERENLIQCPVIIELENVPFSEQELIIFWILDHIQLHGAAFDSRGNGQSIAEKARQRYGKSVVEQVYATAKFYGEWFPKYKKEFEDSSILIPRDEDIKADHRAVKVNNGVPHVPPGKINKGKSGEKRHGDGVIALLLGYYAMKTLKNTGFEFEAVGNQRLTFSEMGLYFEK